jgi:flavin-dependent dehydrogenase
VGIIVSRRGGGEVPLKAPIIIAADGRRSTLAFALDLSSHPLHPRRWAVGAYFDGVSDCCSMGEMHIRSGAYVGVAPLAGGRTNICAVGAPATLAPLSEPLRALRAAIDRIAELRDRTARATVIGAPVVLGPLAVEAHSAGIPGLLLAGDASGFVDPMTGDGLRFAVHGGMLAAEAALETLATGKPDAHVQLTSRMRAAFGTKRRFNRFLRRVVDSPAAVRLAAACASFAPAYVESRVALAGDCGRREGSLPDGSDCCHVDRGASVYPYPR